VLDRSHNVLVSRLLPIVSVRARMLAWVVATAAIGMAIAGVVSYIVQLDRTDARIDGAIVQEVEELRLFAERGVDPESGEPFDAVGRLLEVSMERTVPDERQTFITLVDGTPLGEVLGDVDLPQATHDALLARVSGKLPSVPLVIETIESGSQHVRFAAVPVTVAGDPSVGLYVVAYDVAGERAETTDSFRTYVLVSIGALLLVSLVGWVVAGRLLRPIRLLGRTAQRINDTDLDERIAVSGHDDISDLGHTFNAMLDRIQTAFETQRRFLDDAGHELRTPLTIVRGHLELMDPTDHIDIADTRSLVLDEIERMNRLVGELIVLATARRPDFVATAAVDLERLTTDVHEKASALGDRAWHLDEVGTGVIHVDAQRITQALLQLAENAVKFTEIHDAVALGSRVDGAVVRLWVRDTGPGVSEADAEHIFERFGRGGVALGRNGSGLGLAIVDAIATAHGGRVELATVPGRGAKFTLVLPLDGSAAGLADTEAAALLR